MTTTAPPPVDEAKPKKAVGTSYVVLKGIANQTGDHDISQGWTVEATNVAARSGEDAIRLVAGQKGGDYIAIPRRSFKPVTVTVETKTTVKLG